MNHASRWTFHRLSDFPSPKNIILEFGKESLEVKPTINQAEEPAKTRVHQPIDAYSTDEQAFGSERVNFSEGR